MATTPAGAKAYVSNRGSSNVSVITVANNTLIDTAAHSHHGVGTAPPSIAVTPDGTKAHVSKSGSNDVSAVSTISTGTLTSYRYALALRPDGTPRLHGELGFIQGLAMAMAMAITIATKTAYPATAVGPTPRGIATTPGKDRARTTRGVS